MKGVALSAIHHPPNFVIPSKTREPCFFPRRDYELARATLSSCPRVSRASSVQIRGQLLIYPSTPAPSPESKAPQQPPYPFPAWRDQPQPKHEARSTPRQTLRQRCRNRQDE